MNIMGFVYSTSTSWDLCTFFKAIGSSPLSKRDYFLFFGKTCLVNGDRFFSVYLLDDHWANNRAAQLNIDFFLQGTVSKVSHGM